MEILKKLAALIINPDFNISSDAYETFKEIFLNEMPEQENAAFQAFLDSHSDDILQLFDYL